MAITEDTKTKGFSLQSGPHMSTELDVERLIRKREAALGYRIMASWGWGADGSGHITARDPEHTDCFWLLGYGVPFGEATVDDLDLVNESGDLSLIHISEPTSRTPLS